MRFESSSRLLCFGRLPQGSRVTRLALAASAALAGFVASCGSDQSKNKSCLLSYAKDTEKPLGDNALEITYRAAFSTECQDVYSQNSGRSTMTLQVTSKGADGMYVGELVAGSRNFKFGDKYSLRGGNLQSSFSSDTDAGWAFPWPDAPGTTSLSVLVPKSADKSLWPSAISLQIDAPGS